MKQSRISYGLIAAGLSVSTCIFAQSWTQTSAPSKAWVSIACSADGSRLTAANSSSIYSSTNYGATWTTNYVPNLSWSSVAMSADGSKLAASSLGGGVYVSTNFGVTWNTNNLPVGYYYSVATTGDGSVLAICPTSDEVLIYEYPSGIWLTNHFPTEVFDAHCVALSPSGAMLVAANNIGKVLTCTNLSGGWATTNTVGTGACRAIAVSSDGSKLAAVFGSANIYDSTNSGNTWRTSTFSGSSIDSVAATVDGKMMFAVGGTNYFVSTNYGVNWTPGTMPTNSFVAIAMSADGSLLAAAQSSGGIWVLQTPPGPQLELSMSGSNPKISWTVPSTNFVLQQSLDLLTWSPATTMPSLNYSNLQDEVIVTNSGGSVYYRLKTP
jgi:photosystem II stability/assembly factor-like uncharacterized protein